jgi:hypothetical protein
MCKEYITFCECCKLLIGRRSGTDACAHNPCQLGETLFEDDKCWDCLSCDPIQYCSNNAIPKIIYHNKVSNLIVATYRNTRITDVINSLFDN